MRSLLAASLLVAGCAASTPAPRDLTRGDRAGEDALVEAADLAEGGDVDMAQGGGGDMAQGGKGDMAQAPADLAMPDLAVPPGGKPTGEPCAADVDCTSRMCRAVLPGGQFCVVACSRQSDCAQYLNLYCAPAAAGNPSGFCVPRAATHCASCQRDFDCGILSERCLKAGSDATAACHIDCSIADAAACPPDYACEVVMDGSTPRKLCRPKSGDCLGLDTLGGYCDRVSAPQPCWRENSAGKCTDSRACLAGSSRYGKCPAMAPQFKKSCADQDPAGCKLGLDPAATTVKTDCGACGNACKASEDCCASKCVALGTKDNCTGCGKSCAAGSDCCGGACTVVDNVQNCGGCGKACSDGGKGTAEALCTPQQACSVTCKGENYDLDGDGTTGCEVADKTPPGHATGSASRRADHDCSDSTTDIFYGTIPSDGRIHANPEVEGFNGTVGAAPDYWVVKPTGGYSCFNSYKVELIVSGAVSSCQYKATIITDKGTNSTTTSGATIGRMECGSSCYSTGEDIYFVVEKLCPVSTLPHKNASYSVKFNL